MKTETYEMVAKTFQGLEEILADELRAIGAQNVTVGRRMVSFEGDKEIMYKANLSCRTALRILKPIVKFTADDTDSLYEMTKDFDWTTIMSPDKTFSVDPVVNSDIFTNSRFVTYRVKDGIVDFFKDRFGADCRPGVRLQDADVMINVHIDENRVTLSLDSSGESLHKRGYKVAQTEAPINEVLAAGIILKSGWKGGAPFVDPMCGSGTFLIEAALIAANINPGVYRKSFAFEHWNDFDEELFESLYNDDSNERDIEFPIIGADISPKAIAIAEKNVKQAGVGKYVQLEIKPLSQWESAPEDGVLVTNPPYGERISVDDMEGLYNLLGNKLKRVFKGYHSWVIGYKEEYFNRIGLTPSVKMQVLNGSLECELREYITFEGDYKSFRMEGNSLNKRREDTKSRPQRRLSEDEWRMDARKRGFGGKSGRKFVEERDGDDFDDRRKPRFKDRGADRFKGGRRDDRGDRRFRDDDRRAPRSKDGDRFKSDRRDDRGDRRFRDDDRRAPRFKDEHGRGEERRRSPLEEKYKKRPFGRGGDDRRHDSARDERPRGNAAAESENPLAIRRNEQALKSIIGRQPSLPAMRKRKGWKSSGDAENNDNQ